MATNDKSGPTGGAKRPKKGVTIDLEAKEVGRESGGTGVESSDGPSAAPADSTGAGAQSKPTDKSDVTKDQPSPAPSGAAKAGTEPASGSDRDDAKPGDKTAASAAAPTTGGKASPSTPPAMAASTPSAGERTADDKGGAAADAQSRTDAVKSTPGQDEAASRDAAATVPPEAASRPADIPGDAVAPPPRRAAGFFSALTAAVLGGVIVLGAAYYLGALEFGPRAVTEAPGGDALAERIAALEEELRGLESAGPLQGDRLGDDLTALSQRLAALEGLSEGAGAGDEQVAALVEEVGAIGEQLSQLAARVEEEALRPADGQVSLAAIEERLNRIEAGVAPGDSEPLLQEIAALSSRIETVSGQVDGLRAQPVFDPELGRSIDAATDKLSGLESQLGEIGARLETVATMDEVSRLSAEIDRLSGEIEETRRLAEQANGLFPMLAANRLERRLASGGSLASALDSLAAVGVEDQAIDRLRAYEGDMPTMAELSERWRDVALRIRIGPAAGLPVETGVLDRLIASARSSIDLKGQSGSGSGVEATLTRIDKALSTGDLAGALEAFEALPEPARETATAWHEDAEARLAAEELVDRIQSRALDPLTGGRTGDASSAANLNDRG